MKNILIVAMVCFIILIAPNSSNAVIGGPEGSLSFKIVSPGPGYGLTGKSVITFEVPSEGGWRIILYSENNYYKYEMRTTSGGIKKISMKSMAYRNAYLQPGEYTMAICSAVAGNKECSAEVEYNINEGIQGPRKGNIFFAGITPCAYPGGAGDIQDIQDYATNTARLIRYRTPLVECAEDVGAYVYPEILIMDSCRSNDVGDALARYRKSLGLKPDDIFIGVIMLTKNCPVAFKNCLMDFSGTKVATNTVNGRNYGSNNIAVMNLKAYNLPESVPAVIMHEIGHSVGFDEQYCSKDRSKDPKIRYQSTACNDQTKSKNPLMASLGCDPTSESNCCGIETIKGVSQVWCAGNYGYDGSNIIKSTQASDRSFMSHGTDYFDKNEYDRMAMMDEFKCDSTKKLASTFEGFSDVTLADIGVVEADGEYYAMDTGEKLNIGQYA